MEGVFNFVNEYVGERCCQFYQWVLYYKESLILSMETSVKGVSNFVKGIWVRL